MPSYVKITILCDNTVERPRLLAEHGLSFFIETEGLNILFDTGQGLTLEHNAKELGVNLNSVDLIVLSHGHYDHTTGLEVILKKKNRINVYAHSDILQSKYKRLKSGKMKYTGFPRSLKKDDRLNFTLNTRPFWITKNILLSGEIPRVIPYEKIEEKFYIRSGKNWVKDELRDDQALIIDKPSGLILVLGCAHSGLINTLMYIARLTGKKDFSLIIGGTHLRGASRERIEKTASALAEFSIKKFVLSHCTGILAFSLLRNFLGNRVLPGKVGETYSQVAK